MGSWVQMGGESIKITPEMTRIHAHLCGDGYISRYKEKRDERDIRKYNRKKEKREVFIVGYTNSEPTLIEIFRNDIKRIHNSKLKMTLNKKKREIKVKSKKLFNIFQQLGVGNSRTWSIPQEIFKNTKLAKEWLRAYFDDEAHVEKGRFRIRVKSVNKDGLKQVKELLAKLKIKAKIRDLTNAYLLEISGKENVVNFYLKIGFSHPKKLSSPWKSHPPQC